ncbi:N-acetylglucosaminidase, partial [Virgibacillus litoralis]
ESTTEDGSEESTTEDGSEESTTEDQATDSTSEDGTEEKEELKTATFESKSVTLKSLDVKEKSTSKLGHIHSGATIYETIGDDNSSFSSANYLNAVYYIKKQAKANKQTYYLISEQPSSTKGVIGWVKASDMSTHSHVGVDWKSKSFIIKGSGNAYSKAWGGSKDLVYDLSDYKNKEFKVHLTEKVGGNIWYRGNLNGKTVWVHSSYVLKVEKSHTSKLGHIHSGTTIYKSIMDGSTSFSSEKYLNAVYYIKQQAKVGGQTYYLISKQPSRTSGVVGWIKASNMSTNPHVGVDRKSKTFFIKGSGSAFSKAWGGSKDLVYDLSKYRNNAFKVHLTEKVGGNIWYRGNLDGKVVWVHSSYVTSQVDNSHNDSSSTSRLGHLSYDANIYPDLDNLSSYVEAAGTFNNAVYYIKKQAEENGDKFYLISTQPSSNRGVIGWVKSTDMSSHSHIGIDSRTKTYYVKGSGSAYSKAWGGSKDLVYKNLSEHKYQVFKVNLTEKVGGNTWYRGTLDGKTAWLHSSYVTTKEVSSTSKLGHLRYDANIYPGLHNQSNVKKAKNGYINSVYYIKEQTVINGQTYYLISNKPSSTKGLVGWVNSQDISTNPHTWLDSYTKTYYIKGSGNAYSKAWGGSKDLVYDDLSNFAGESFRVNLTEDVGGNTWYRGVLNGKNAWIHGSFITKSNGLTLNQAVDIQLKGNPQTDKDYAYVSKDYIKDSKVTASSLNVRTGPATYYGKVGSLANGTTVNIIDQFNGWYVIEHYDNQQWVSARPADVKYNLNPDNFLDKEVEKFQFLDLSRSSGASKSVLNNFLEGKGTLAGEGQAFIDAGNIYGINDAYLVSHAILETGHGDSTLAQGVEYKGETVYNVYGVHAFDSCPITCGAKKAYDEGWDTPAKAIIGGAKFIGNNYIKGSNSYNTVQNTLYKMRWNPEYMATEGSYGHQYATDIGWASKQVYTMYDLYQDLGSYTLQLDIPVYK